MLLSGDIGLQKCTGGQGEKRIRSKGKKYNSITFMLKEGGGGAYTQYCTYHNTHIICEFTNDLVHIVHCTTLVSVLSDFLAIGHFGLSKQSVSSIACAALAAALIGLTGRPNLSGEPGEEGR